MQQNKETPSSNMHTYWIPVLCMHVRVFLPISDSLQLTIAFPNFMAPNEDARQKVDITVCIRHLSVAPQKSVNPSPHYFGGSAGGLTLSQGWQSSPVCFKRGMPVMARALYWWNKTVWHPCHKWIALALLSRSCQGGCRYHFAVCNLWSWTTTARHGISSLDIVSWTSGAAHQGFRQTDLDTACTQGESGSPQKTVIAVKVSHRKEKPQKIFFEK